MELIKQNSNKNYRMFMETNERRVLCLLKQAMLWEEQSYPVRAQLSI